MAAALWYYPNNTGQAVKIALSRPIVDRVGPNQEMQQSTTQAWSGQISTVQWGGPDRITLKHLWGGESAADRTIRRDLVALVNHLKRGGRVMLAEDDTLFYAAFVQVLASPGESAFSVYTPITDSIQSSNDLDGQEVVFRSCAPDCIQEAAIVTTQTGSGFSVSKAIVQDFTEQAWVLVRQWGSWPAMRLVAEQRNNAKLIHDHEISFSLELELEEDESVLNALSTLVGALSDEDGIGGGFTLEDAEKEVGGGPLALGGIF